MEIARSYITDDEGKIKSVVIDFETFRKIEQALLDQGLARAMSEIQEDGELSIEEARLALREV